MNSVTDNKRGYSRRAMLATGASVLGVALAGGSLAASGGPAGGISSSDFQKLSGILTNRATLDPHISDRAFAALSAEDGAFAAKAQQLYSATLQAGLRDMRQYKGFIAGHADLDPTAKKIISAWYLGYTGTPEGESNVDDARFVSYAGALMYEPTKDATIVPTYARGHTNYWVDPPSTLATD